MTYRYLVAVRDFLLILGLLSAACALAISLTYLGVAP